ncbi:hypothetical protein [Streptomyces sp. S186]|uniref:hypothetical protein n=1 Tax=Streptomyces sp. S186 TaxID=3434395 RepID=UPI003F670380
MHKLHKAAVMAAALSSFALFGAGAAHATGRGGGGFDVSQHNSCRSHDLNVDVLGEVGILNGLLGNALGGEGQTGAQGTSMGSRMGCNNSVGGEDDGGEGHEHGGGGGGGGGGGHEGGGSGGHGGGMNDHGGGGKSSHSSDESGDQGGSEGGGHSGGDM